MDQMLTGMLIRRLRLGRGLTQLALAERLNVSDRAVSKWERGAGLPDVGTLASLARELGVRVEDLLAGSLPENDTSGGNMRKSVFYACPACGNIILGATSASVACCGRTLEPLKPQKPDEAHTAHIDILDGERYVTIEHPMGKDHYIDFLAFLSSNTALLARQYPEWPAQAHFPLHGHGRILWHCVKDGLFYQDI